MLQENRTQECPTHPAGRKVIHLSTPGSIGSLSVPGSIGSPYTSTLHKKHSECYHTSQQTVQYSHERSAYEQTQTTCSLSLFSPWPIAHTFMTCHLDPLVSSGIHLWVLPTTSSISGKPPLLTYDKLTSILAFLIKCSCHGRCRSTGDGNALTPALSQRERGTIS